MYHHEEDGGATAVAWPCLKRWAPAAAGRLKVSLPTKAIGNLRSPLPTLREEPSTVRTLHRRHCTSRRRFAGLRPMAHRLTHVDRLGDPSGDL